MEFKGTKGEWKYEGDNNSSIDIVLDNLTTISIDRYHRYTGELIGSRIEMEANAKLIAASPELLEALQELIIEYENKGQLLGYNVDIARKAIEKALK